MASAKWRPFCLGLNELNVPILIHNGPGDNKSVSA